MTGKFYPIVEKWGCSHLGKLCAIKASDHQAKCESTAGLLSVRACVAVELWHSPPFDLCRLSVTQKRLWVHNPLSISSPLFLHSLFCSPQLLWPSISPWLLRSFNHFPSCHRHALFIPPALSSFYSLLHRPRVIVNTFLSDRDDLQWWKERNFPQQHIPPCSLLLFLQICSVTAQAPHLFTPNSIFMLRFFHRHLLFSPFIGRCCKM